MRNNRRGIKAWRQGRASQWLVLGVLGLFMVFSAGCSLKLPFSSSPGQKKEHHKKKAKKITPVIVNYGKNNEKIKVAYKHESYEEIDSKKETPKLTLMQKIGRFISGLGFIWLILFAVCPPAAIMIGKIIFNKIRGMRTALYETVRGIENSKTVGLNGEVHNALSSAQSEETKAYIRKLKAEIKSKTFI